MKIREKKSADLLAPRQQRNWDWRAAANFIAGGAGGGLLLWAAFAGLSLGATRAAILLGLVLIGSGLTCVWFEIGRPWRALNVYRHFATSWMTREAVVALVLFAVGGLAWLTANTFLVVLNGLLGLVFLYSQARILSANKGIPTWRHPASVPLMVATGLTEGAGFLACIAALATTVLATSFLIALLSMIVLRAFFWKSYLGGLMADGAPDGALKILKQLAPRFIAFGHLFPAGAIIAVIAGIPGQTSVLFIAGIMLVASGWFMKFTLVRRAAFTQGLALPRLPVRGNGTAGPAVKPGWKTLSQSNAG